MPEEYEYSYRSTIQVSLNSYLTYVILATNCR